ncbi:MAG TPA: ribosomal-processing cysteine protease Prp [bacterium]|nr:ribosomal-processing cysteine protease Prp [bacterium]HOL48202.1 ribosomal-processing cysteine protease Prp [bacterium]HPQ19188.1 ribosomal-processing cysteine protease Prp [bacterium]
MINIFIQKTQKKISKILISGHSFEGKKGNNIICAAVSAVVKMLVVGLQDIIKTKLTIIAENEGEIEIELKENILENEKAKVLFETFIKTIEWIDKKYKNNITLKFIE